MLHFLFKMLQTFRAIVNIFQCIILFFRDDYIVKWTDNAMDGLARVHVFLAEINLGAAQQAMDAIEAGVDMLEQFPNAGRPADDLEPEHRELLIPFGGAGYALFYEVVGDTVFILAVKHQKEAGY